MVRALLLVAMLPAVASADGNLCAQGAKHHGAIIDLDLKDADIRDVLRLLADVGKVNLVVGDNIDGKVTLRMKRVAWDAATCTIAAVNHLTVTVQDNILLIRKADR